MIDCLIKSVIYIVVEVQITNFIEVFAVALEGLDFFSALLRCIAVFLNIYDVDTLVNNVK